MAVTQNTYTGNGSTVLYSFTFPYLETTDIKVSVNGSTTTAYTLANATTIQFNTAPANGAAIRIYRQTDDSALAATFYPGSAIRSSDLNDNFTQNLYVTQESSNSAAAATTTANTALTNSTTAINTANASTATANTALSNSQTALTQSASAVSTANSASSSASSAVSTANSAAADAATALTQSSAAVATANTSASNAATALSNSQTALTQSASALSASAAATSTANTAAANAASAVSTANTASSNAAAALNAVANSVQYQLVAAVANIPASPSNGDAIEIANSTGIESFSPLANRPAGFVGDTGLSVRMQYSSAGSTWNWLNYFSNDSDTRYLKKSGGTLTGALTLNADPTQNLQAATKQYVDNVANAGGLPLTGGTMTGQILGDNSTSPTTPGYAFDGDPNTGMYRPGADELALVTGGTARLTIDPAGGVAITNGLNVGGQTAVVTNDARLSNTRTPTDGSVTDAKVAANAAIAGSKIQAASTTNAGAVQLTDSTSSTSTTTAATPNAVKSAYDLANAALPKAGGALTGDVTLNAQSDLRFADADSSNWVALQGPATVSSNVTWTLPSADGTSGQVLSTNGSGTLSWATASSGASITASDTPPSSPTANQLWYDSVGGRTYVYYQDPNGSQWVDASPQGGGGSGTSITTGNTTAEVIDTGSDGRFVVTTEGTEALRVDASRRLLVGTSSARANMFNSIATSTLGIEAVAATTGAGRISVVYNDNSSDGSSIIIGKSRATSVGGSTVVQSGDALGGISWQGADGTELVEAAFIRAEVDGTPGANDMPGRLVFSTTADGASSPTERMRITNAGHVGIGVTPTYRFDVAASAANSYIGFHENTANTADDNLYLWRMGANANSVSANFLYCQTSTTQRFGLRGNGGLANYQANNVNLSDRNAKKDISPAADTWNCIKEWEIVNYRYKDQPDDADLNLGVIAQQVAESCPEVITVFQEATDDQPEKLGVKEQQMYWMAIKALQEAQVRIETLEAQNASLEARLTALEGGN